MLGDDIDTLTGWKSSGIDPSLSGTNLERAGDHNQRVTLHAIRANAGITRPELVDITGLTAPAIANITRRLMVDGLILEAGRKRGARGQPAARLVINPECYFSIGVNIDRDHCTVVLLDFEGNMRGRLSEEVAYALPDDVAAIYRKALLQFSLLAFFEPGRIIGVGVCRPDNIDRLAVSNPPPGYAQWADVAFEDMFGTQAQWPVYVENDASAAAMGEMHFGLGHRYLNFLYILVTAGLGSGLIIDGDYYDGATGRSGELGWLPVTAADGTTCQVQDIVSVYALYRYLARQGIVAETPEDIAQLSLATLDGWIAQAVEALLDPLVSVNCLLNPEVVLIGGRLPGALIDELARRLNTALQMRAGSLPAIAPVERAIISEDAPAMGAGILPFAHRLLPMRSVLRKTAQARD